MKRKSLLVAGLISIFSLFLFVGVARAQSVKSGDVVTVGKNQKVDSMLVATGRTITIDGVVDGDLYCAGQTVSISGTVNGDVFCAAQTIRITGVVDGSVRAAGQTVIYDGDTTGSVSLAGQTVSLDENAMVGRDLTIAGSAVNVKGVISRDAVIGAETVVINAEIGRNLNGQYNKLVLGSSAEVKGSIDYTSKTDLVKEQGSNVSGSVNRRDPPKKQNSKMSLSGIFGFFVYMFIALMIVSLTLVLIFPAMFMVTNKQINKGKGRVALIGILSLMLAPLTIFLIALSIVGLPLAGMALLGWMLILSLSGPVAAYYVGSKIIRNNKSPFVIMLTGSAVILALYIIPGVNILVGIFVGVFGTGALLSSLHIASSSNSKQGK